MRITIDFNHEEDFERIKKLIRKADKLEQEGRFKLGSSDMSLIYSALMRSDIYEPIGLSVGELLHRGEDAKVSNQYYEEGTFDAVKYQSSKRFQ